jgi:hypothetical protein
MKHTNFFPQILKIKAQEKSELLAAVAAHNGDFSWGDEDEKPIVAINWGITNPRMMDVEVQRIAITKRNRLDIFGVESETGDLVFSDLDVLVGNLSNITERILETDKITDVTVYRHP